MEIALHCEENQIKSFVENIDDIEILFASMSPAIEAFFENGFVTTRFTEKIKNLNWEIGDTLKVFGKTSSVVNEETASQSFKTMFKSENVQKR